SIAAWWPRSTLGKRPGSSYRDCRPPLAHSSRPLLGAGNRGTQGPLHAERRKNGLVSAILLIFAGANISSPQSRLHDPSTDPITHHQLLHPVHSCLVRRSASAWAGRDPFVRGCAVGIRGC